MELNIEHNHEKNKKIKKIRMDGIVLRRKKEGVGINEGRSNY